MLFKRVLSTCQPIPPKWATLFREQTSGVRGPPACTRERAAGPGRTLICERVDDRARDAADAAEIDPTPRHYAAVGFETNGTA